MCTIICGQFSAKATAKDITKHLSPRKPKLCTRKNREAVAKASKDWNQIVHNAIFDCLPNQQLVASPASSINFVAARTFDIRRSDLQVSDILECRTLNLLDQGHSLVNPQLISAFPSNVKLLSLSCASKNGLE